MGLDDYKISNWKSPVTNLADRPKMTAANLKAAFDSNSNELKEAHNKLIEYLKDPAAMAEMTLTINGQKLNVQEFARNVVENLNQLGYNVSTVQKETIEHAEKLNEILGDSFLNDNTGKIIITHPDDKTDYAQTLKQFIQQLFDGGYDNYTEIERNKEILFAVDDRVKKVEESATFSENSVKRLTAIADDHETRIEQVKEDLKANGFNKEQLNFQSNPSAPYDDCNTVPANSVVVYGKNLPSNLPEEVTGTLISFGNETGSVVGGQTQLYMTSTSHLYARSSWGDSGNVRWLSWNRLDDAAAAIDPTLSVSGKAADAAKVGEVVNAESERAKVAENQLKEDIVGQRDRLTVIDGNFTPTFEVGTYVVSDGKLTKGNSYIQNKRVRTTNPIDFEAGDVITLDDFTNKKISLFFKVENDKYTQSADIVGEYTVPNARANAYLQVRYVDESLAPSPAIIDELATLVVRKKDNIIAEIKAQLVEEKSNKEHIFDFCGIESLSFETGGINNSTGEDYIATDRIRSNYLNVSGATELHTVIDTNAGVNIYEYDADKKFIKKTTLNISANDGICLQVSTAYVRITILETISDKTDHYYAYIKAGKVFFEIEKINKKIDQRTISENGIFEPFESTALNGYVYASNGKVLIKEDDSYHLYLKIPVNEGEKYRANFRIGKSNILAIRFADEKLNYIDAGWSNPDEVTSFENYEIAIQSGVKYLFITSLKSVSPTIEKFRRYTIQEELSMKESFRENETKAIFSFMTYNVGDWYEGAWRSEDKTGIIPADESIYQKYMALHESILRRYSCDFVCFNEYSDKMCMSRHIQADEFVGQFYPYIEKGVMIKRDGIWNVIASKRKLNNVTTGFYQNTESGITRSYTKGYVFLNGRKVCIICTHFSSTPETAALNAQEMLEVVTNEDYFILCGDFNCDVFRKTSEVLYKNIVGVFANAGYKLCNGGEKGDFLTLGNTELSSGADIIVTSSNIVIKSVLADQQKVEASIAVNDKNGFINRIDHVPLIAYLEIF